MNIKDIFNKNKTSLSFEFFPPKSEKANLALFENIKTLNALDPSFVSVTYGAGGATRQFTHDLLIKLKKETNLEIVSHITCVGHSREEIFEILQQYSDAGINNIMALRGDPQDSRTFEKHPNGFKYASEMVKFIKVNFPQMGIGVAGFPEGHPETPNRLLEIDYLKAKVDSGADYICSQLFFDNKDYYDFCERCELAGISIPIIAGIMPITSKKGMNKMADLALGARFPAKLMRAISRVDSDDSISRVGIHWATEQVRDLIDNNVRGIHFYTLNKSNATREIYMTLGL